MTKQKNKFKDETSERSKELDKMIEEFSKKLESEWAKCERSLKKKIKKIMGDFEDVEDLDKYLKKKRVKTEKGKRLTRKDLIEIEINEEIKSVRIKEEEIAIAALLASYSGGYYRSIFDISKVFDSEVSFKKVTDREIEAIFSKEWKGESYSSRIWKNSQKTAQAVLSEVIESVLIGKSVAKMGQAIRSGVGGGLHNSKRLVRTEVNYVYNQAILKGYEDSGVDRYQFIATLDDRTAQKDGELDSQVFKIVDAVVGENLPPIHPNCRCRIIAYIPEVKRDRLGVNSEGKRVRMGDITFLEWQKLHSLK